MNETWQLHCGQSTCAVPEFGKSAYACRLTDCYSKGWIYIKRGGEIKSVLLSIAKKIIHVNLP